jgi:8-oxo-dGTP pyrophosphatase MutT (NUDIX family)
LVDTHNLKLLSEALKLTSEDCDTDAAVALLLRQRKQDLNIFLVKRVDNPVDSWSGHMALPGGRRSENDRDLKETVIRETLEETNINLFYRCHFLGMMEPEKSMLKEKILVLPFVFHLTHEPTIRLNEELEWFDWVPLEELIRNRSILGDRPAYVLGERVVWGLTYRILERLFCILQHALKV